jgi:hypothetical protein
MVSFKSLISPPPTTSTSPTKRLDETAAIRETRSMALEARPPSIRKRAVKESHAHYLGDKAIVGSHNAELPSPSPSTRKSHTLQELIGKTTRTLVFKVTRSNATVAVKICRKPTLKESAETWRNEMEIMRTLDHISAHERASI